tara:strand:+ start:572 stop:1843 length:1272 start_codon:yes stop_codon:yes gene_type:complete
VFNMNVYNSTYDDLKSHYDQVLNKDKTTYKNSNDEPTPIGCIEDMYSSIPQSFWNEGVEILDPCCGNGNFHLVTLQKLKSIGIDIGSIVDNNLYFNDINEDRIKNVKKVFGNNSNIFKKDFLQFEDTRKFDMVVANPPFALFTEDNKRASKNHTLVRDFISKAISVTKENGYVLFIVPNNWMSYANRNVVIEEITKRQIIHLDIHGSKKWFPKIGSSFTWFLLKNAQTCQPYTTSTLYKKSIYSSVVQSGERKFIPLLWTTEVQSIFSKTIDVDNEKFAVETTSDLHAYTKKKLLSKEKDQDHPYRLWHTPSTNLYSSRPHKYQDGFKTFISLTNVYSLFVDNCGMTQSIAFVRCESEEKAMETSKILDHNLYRFLNNVCRWGNFNNIKILKEFPIPQNPNDIYGSFGITNEEIQFIENFLSA